MFFEWYEGMAEDASLAAPQVAVSEKLKVVFPRGVPMAWSGVSENSYEVSAVNGGGSESDKSAPPVDHTIAGDVTPPVITVNGDDPAYVMVNSS